jgi:hypothetical protein
MSAPTADSSSTMAPPTQFHSIHDVTTAVGSQLATARAKHWTVFGVVEPGIDLAGRQAADSLEAVCYELGRRFQNLLSGRDGFRYFAGLRQISQRIWGHFEGGVASEFHTTARDLAEIAVHRYADWNRALRVPGEQLPGWTKGSCQRLAELVVLAEFYGNTLAARRRSGKGQVLRLSSSRDRYPWECDPDAAVERLIGIRDERGKREGNLLSSYGGFLRNDADDAESARIIAAAYLDPEVLLKAHMLGSLNRKDEQLAAHQAIAAAITWWNFLPDLSSSREAVSEYDSPLKAQFGFGLLDLEFCLDVCSSKVMVAWETPPFLDGHGFTVAPAATRRDFEAALTTSRQDDGGAWAAVTVDSAEQAMRFLDAGRHAGNLDNPKGIWPIRIIGEHMLYDAVHVRLPSPLLWSAQFDEESRAQMARRFESDTHLHLAPFGSQPWPVGKNLQVSGRTFTDVDASLVIDDLLVVVDCYNSRWTPELDIGSHAVTRNRADNLVAKLDKWDQQWRTIASTHPRLLPAGVRRVLPVVATPGAEWIPSLDDRLWLRSDVPRICTLSELAEELSSHGSAERSADVEVA